MEAAVSARDNSAAGGHRIEIAGADLDFREVRISDPRITGAQILALYGAQPRDAFVVLQWLETGDIEEIRVDELVDVNGGERPRFIVAETDRLFRLILNDRSVSWPDRKISEAALRKLGAVPDGERLYVRREEVPDEPIPDGGTLGLGEAGVEIVYSKAEVWTLNVQGNLVESREPTIIVRDALVRAGFTPDGWIIVLKTADGKRQVELDHVIDLRQAGIEKIRLTPREINNGEAFTPLRTFPLLPGDEAGLNARGGRWETITEAGRRWLILHDVELPAGYHQTHTTIAIEVPTGYPMAELDMFYCAPHLSRVDGGAIPQTQVTQTLMGTNFQRWSRHRGAVAPWRPGIDNALTHLALVDASILREVEP
jgi:hypothetical protein